MGWGWFSGRGKLEIEAIKLNDVAVFKEVYDYAKKYDIDITDAIQLYAILKGIYSRLIGGSRSVLITADEKLEQAAMKEQIRVWNCVKTDKPNWLDS